MLLMPNRIAAPNRRLRSEMLDALTAMLRRPTILHFSCLLLLVAGWLLLLPPTSGAGCQLALAIVGTTNAPMGARMVTLRPLNIGQRSAQVLLAYAGRTCQEGRIGLCCVHALGN